MIESSTDDAVDGCKWPATDVVSAWEVPGVRMRRDEVFEYMSVSL